MSAPPEKKARGATPEHYQNHEQGDSAPAPAQSQVFQYAQKALDSAEDFAARREWFWLTFKIIALKAALGLRYHR